MKARTAILLVVAIPIVAVLVATPACDLLTRVFGPPDVKLSEQYQKNQDGATFDHSRLDAVLHDYVTEDGWVDYARLAKDPGQLDAYIAEIGNADWDALDRDEKFALLINAYNAFTLRLILDHWPLASIRDIPSAKRWSDQRWRVGKLTVSLESLEHEYLRKRFKDPRMHFAINCASVGCPPLRTEAYTGEKLETQLQAQVLRVHHSPTRWFQLQKSKVRLTQIYRWFGRDFKQVAGSVLAFAARFSPELALRMQQDHPPRIEWLAYDWSINSIESKARKR